MNSRVTIGTPEEGKLRAAAAAAAAAAAITYDYEGQKIGDEKGAASV